MNPRRPPSPLCDALLLCLALSMVAGCAPAPTEREATALAAPLTGEALIRAAREADVAGERRRAADLYTAYLDDLPATQEAAALATHVALLYEGLDDQDKALESWERIVWRYRDAPNAQGLYVEALSKLAALARAQGRRGEAALLETETIVTYETEALPAGSSAAAAAARARCAQLDERLEDLRYMPVAGPDLNRTITSLEQMQQKMEALVQDYRALGDYESTVWWVTGQCRTGEAYEIVARNFRGLPLTLGGVDYPKLKAAFERIATRLDAHAHTGFQRTVQYAETLAIPTDTLERAFQAIDEGTWDHTPDFRKTMSAYRWRHPQSKRTGPSAPESPKAAQ